MNPPIQKFSTVNFNNIVYRPILKAKDMAIIYVQYLVNNKKVPLLIEVPALISNEPYNNDKNEIILELQGKTDEISKAVDNFFISLDDRIVSDVQKHSKSWNLKSKNVKYKAIVTMGQSNGKHAIKLKVNDRANFKTIVYNKNRDQLLKEEYTKLIGQETFIKSIIEISSIWFTNDVICVDIKVHQLRISSLVPKSVHIVDYSFTDSEDDEFLGKEIDLTQSEFPSSKPITQSEKSQTVILPIKQVTPLPKPILNDKSENKNVRSESKTVKYNPKHVSVKEYYINEKSDTSNSNSDEDDGGNEILQILSAV